MKEWLQKKNVTFSVSDMKDQIWKIVSCNLPEKVYRLDQYAEEHGHSVLRSPPYHCHFNAIEMVWSECKRFYDEEIIKTRSTVDDVLKIWNMAIKKVSAEHWKNYVAHTEISN
jgi:transposase